MQLTTHHGAVGIPITGWWGPSSWLRTCHRAVVVITVTRDPLRGLGDPHHGWGPVTGPWGLPLQLGTHHKVIVVSIVVGDLSRGLGDPPYSWGPFMGTLGSPQ